jgi:hypothetical protein
MLVTSGTLVRRYQELDTNPYGLGRHMVLDARSLDYTVERDEDKMATSVKPVTWLPSIPILNQGQVGSCTGNASTYHLSNLYTKNLPKCVLSKDTLSTSTPNQNEKFALEVYHEATTDDGLGPPYPPNDRGSSGLGASKAMLSAKLITQYTWATTLEGWMVLMQTRGTIIGTPWYQAFFEPDSNGFIDSDPSWEQSGIAGGHEIYICSLEAWNPIDPSKSVVAFPNSWDTSWGDQGYGRLHLSTYLKLQSQIDVKQFELTPA